MGRNFVEPGIGGGKEAGKFVPVLGADFERGVRIFGTYGLGRADAQDPDSAARVQYGSGGTRPGVPAPGKCFKKQPGSGINARRAEQFLGKIKGKAYSPEDKGDPFRYIGFPGPAVRPRRIRN
jgi:hypothetical protein